MLAPAHQEVCGARWKQILRRQTATKKHLVGCHFAHKPQRHVELLLAVSGLVVALPTVVAVLSQSLAAAIRHTTSKDYYTGG